MFRPQEMETLISVSCIPDEMQASDGVYPP